MSNPTSNTSAHLVIRLHHPGDSCAVKQAGGKGDGQALVLRIKEATHSLSHAEPGSNDVCMLIDLSTKEFWQTRCLREMAYCDLLSDVMPKLDIPNYILLDPKFAALQHSEQKTRVKELCEAVAAVKQAMVTFKTVKVTVRDPFDWYSREPKMIEEERCKTDEGLPLLDLMHKHKLPPGFSLEVVKGTDGMKIQLSLEKERLFRLFSKDSEKATKGFSTCWFDTLIERIAALGPALRLGKTEYYESSSSGYYWPFREASFFPDPKTINDKLDSMGDRF